MEATRCRWRLLCVGGAARCTEGGGRSLLYMVMIDHNKTSMFVNAL